MVDGPGGGVQCRHCSIVYVLRRGMAMHPHGGRRWGQLLGTLSIWGSTLSIASMCQAHNQMSWSTEAWHMWAEQDTAKIPQVRGGYQRGRRMGEAVVGRARGPKDIMPSSPGPTGP
jgi:hypothetical protein